MNQRKLVAAAVSSALALPMAAQAVEFAVSGHVSRNVMSVDSKYEDGRGADDLRHVDNGASGSRFRFTGSEELDGGMTVGINAEMGILTGDKSGTTTRHTALFLGTPGGKLTMGHTSPAADGMAFARLGGPSFLGGGATNACNYYTKNGAGGDAVACHTANASRREVIRYDTPSLGPISFAVSAGDNDYWDVMLKAAGSFGDAGGYDFRIGHVAEYEVTTVTPESKMDVTVPGGYRQVDAGALFEEVAKYNRDNNLEGTDAVPTTIAGIKRIKATGTQYYLIQKDDTSSDALDGRIAATPAESAAPMADATRLTGSYDPDARGSGDNAIASNLYAEHVPTTVNEVTTEASNKAEKMGDVVTVSGAVSFGPVGVNAAWSKDKSPMRNEDHETTFLGVDYSYGDGSIGLSWRQGEKGNGIDDDGTSLGNTDGTLWGVGWGHNIGPGVEAYAGYQHIEEDGVTDDVSIILAGMRVSFN